MIRKRRRARRSEWSLTEILQLANFEKGPGHGICWHGFRTADIASVPEDIWANMREAWLEAGPRIMEVWPSPGHRPRAWWWFDSEAPRDHAKMEQEQLFELGLLGPEELAAVEAKAIDADRRLHATSPHGQDLPFRRDWLFWQFVSPVLRDEDESEAAQLVRMGVLTERERDVLADPKMATLAQFNQSRRTRFYYLSEGEREQIGLAPYHPKDEELDRPLPPAASRPDETEEEWAGEPARQSY